MHNSRLYVEVCKANNWANTIDVPRWHLRRTRMKKHTSQPLTAARIGLRPRERLTLPRMKGNPSDSKAETG